MISTLKVNFVTLMETCTGSAGIRALLDLLNYNDCQAAPAQFKALSEAVEALYIIWESIKNLVLDSSLESAPRLAAVFTIELCIRKSMKVSHSIILTYKLNNVSKICKSCK
jgi:hypothetical protein